MSRLFRRFPQVKVLLVGDLLADQYLFGQTERVSREAPVLIVRYEREELKLGGGANAAANARSLGAQVTVVGALGRDALGKQMAGLFRAQGMHLQAVRTAVTEARTRVLAGGLSTSRQQMLRIDKGAVGPLPPAQRRALAKKVLECGARVDVVMVSDYGAGVLCAETWEALQHLRKMGVPVCVDSRFQLAACTGMTVCKPNEPELAAFTGLSVSDDAQVERAAAVALERLGCDVLLVTRGRKGMRLFQRSKPSLSWPPHGAQEAVDVTGAGDTVSATFAVCLGGGASPQEAAGWANIAGGLVVQKAGTATVTCAELEEAAR